MYSKRIIKTVSDLSIYLIFSEKSSSKKIPSNPFHDFALISRLNSQIKIVLILWRKR